jgi:tetratricopeptide (TPR) repeat protein
VAKAMLGGDIDLPVRFFDRLFAETEGNPLFIREILRALSAPSAQSAGGSLVFTDDAWRLVGAVTAWQIPDSVENAIAERLDLIDPAQRTELELAAVIGRRFAFEVFATLSESDESDLLDYLEALLNFDIIREINPSDETFEFSHGKIRDVLYESMSHLRRARVHAQVADVLIQLDSRGANEDWSALIGEHLLLGRKYDEALPYLLAAARSAMTIQAAREAEGLFGKWLEAARRAREAPDEDPDQIELDRAEALKAAADYEAAGDLLRDIASRQVSQHIRGWALNHLGDIDLLRGEVDRAIECYEQCELLARDSSDLELECETAADLAELHMRMAERLAGIDPDTAAMHSSKYNEYLDREVVSATELDIDHFLARAYRNRAKHDRTNGRLEEAVEGYEAALEKTDRRIASHQYIIPYAKALRLVGRSSEALQRADEVLTWSRQIGSLRSEAIARQYRGLIMYETALDTGSDLAPAREELALALSLHQDISFDQGRRETEVILGELELSAGDPGAAERHFRASYESATDAEAALKAAAGELRANGEVTRANRILDALASTTG